MSESANRLVEHFFRHESANLIAVLTRAFGIRRLDLVEDMVQVAMLEAMNAWKQSGVPDNPAAWIHRAAKNRILDSLRREKTHEKAIALSGQTLENQDSIVDRWLEEEQLPDSLLRMMFACCHPSLERRTQIALTMKTLCGFGVAEISRGLLLPQETIKKRIQRAKKTLAENNVALELPPTSEITERLDVVHDVLYLMFNEGYSTSLGIEPIRDDICEEAARLCHLLCESGLGTTTTNALLSLLLFHGARLDSRIDEKGAIVLLEDQDRSKWDHRLIKMAEHWLAKSQSEQRSTYHLEAVIAMQHCIADSVESTNWPLIVQLYDNLLRMHNSPIYRLNRAIALAQNSRCEEAISELERIQNLKEMRDYFLLDCALAKVQEMNGDEAAAANHYSAALTKSLAPHERQLVEGKLSRLSG